MKLFGLIGFPLGHSFSKSYFTQKFQREGITEAAFENYPLEDISLLPALIGSNPQLRGLSVTIPFKEQVLKYLDEADESVREIGACNCIHINNGKLFGFNTDVIGFRISLEEYLKPHHRQALILGEGGAAKAVAFVLKQLGIKFRFVVRRGSESESRLFYSHLTIDTLQQFQLVVNATPVGTFPNIDDAPDLPYEGFSAAHYVFDLVYNPPKTKLLQLAEAKGATVANGQNMLEIQAEAAWRIWNG